MRIPLTRPYVGAEEIEEIKSVIASGWLANGPEVQKLERRVSEYVGSKYSVATSSCTAALSLALEACAVKRGTEVIVPDFTFPATGNVVYSYGCKPVLVEVRLDDYSIDPTAVTRAITRKTSAVIVVHPFGHPARMDEIFEIAEKKGVEVIQDAATALGTRYRDKPIGSQGRAVCFSFHPRKLLTTGEGGCLTTSDRTVAERANALRNHGQVSEGGHIRFQYNGYNFRMSDIQAAVGVVQMSKIDRIITKRRKQARLYDELILKEGLKVHLTIEAEWAFSTYQSYVVRLGQEFPISRDQCIVAMRKRFGIETQVGTYSLHTEPSFAGTKRIGRLRNATKLYMQSLTLPAYHEMAEAQQRQVVDALAKLSSPS